ncbi:MAG: DUF447 family protein [Pirellulaceae bacterium]|nr:DUF447 family protein [Pirellulaceae bacterium]
MILEGIVTTRNADGTPNISPMGPEVNESTWDTFKLKPFHTANTYQNLKRTGQGVLHVTDDVKLFVDGAISRFEDLPAMRPAEMVQGDVLTDCCRFYEFTTLSVDDSSERIEIQCQTVQSGELRPFWGFNRAKHAVLEAAILATRIHLIKKSQLQDDLARLGSIVRKTAGLAEKEAFHKLALFFEEKLP